MIYHSVFFIYMCSNYLLEWLRTTETIAMSTFEYLNRFRSGITKIRVNIISIVWKNKHDFDAGPFNVNRNTVRGTVSIRV